MLPTLLATLVIGVLPHPPDPYYTCLFVVRPLNMAVLCVPAQPPPEVPRVRGLCTSLPETGPCRT